MGAFEFVVMVAALGFMFAAVAAKVMTAQLISRMKGQIARVAQTKAEALGRLKGAQSQKAVGEQNKAKLLAKKTKLTKQLTRLRNEMGQMKDEEQARRQRTEMRRVE